MALNNMNFSVFSSGNCDCQKDGILGIELLKYICLQNTAHILISGREVGFDRKLES